MRFRPGNAMEEPLSMGSQYANGAHPRAGTRHCQANCRAETRQPQLSIQRPAAAATSAAKSLSSFSTGVLRALHAWPDLAHRSEEHQSELQSLMRTSYAVFC